MSVGQTFSRAPEVTFYSKAEPCPVVSQGFQPSLIRFAAHHDSLTFFTNITLENVITLDWLTTEGTVIETYHYAEGYGLVGWEGAGKLAAISEIHEPGAREDNVRETISCLLTV